MANGFFLATRNAAQRLSDAYDFFWPAKAGLWTLRWQVLGYLQEVPNATEDELNARFVHPSGPGHNYRALKSVFSKITWESQQGRIAENLLLVLVGIYEAWLKAVLAAAKVPKADQVEKDLQFPLDPKKKGGVKALSNATSAKSPALVGAFRPATTSHAKYSLQELNSLLICYRYFKEMRNALAHNGGQAHDRAVDSSTEYANLLQTSTLGMKHPPPGQVLTADAPIALALAPVVAFGDVLLRMLVTVDAELATSAGAESEVLREWKKRHGERVTFPADPARCNQKVANKLALIGMPRPVPDAAITRLLRDHRLIY